MACVKTEMYKLKPVFDLNEVQVNSPMYSVKSFQNFKTNDDEGGTLNSDNHILDIVEAKQDLLFKLIGEIKDLLATLKKELAVPKIESKSSDSSTMPLSMPQFSNLRVLHEVVLNASVKNPPNSLLVLDQLWRHINFVFSWHTHSSVKGLPKNFKRFESINSLGSSDNPQLRIRVVWKEVWSDCELVVSPLSSVPLLGEVNFLRFLSRGAGDQETTDPYISAYVDSKLDACHSLSYCDSIQQSQEFYCLLSEGLEKRKWMTGDTISIVDVACWSAINNMKNPNLNPLLSRWYKDFNSVINLKK